MNANFLRPTNEHPPPFGLCLRPDNDINEALSPLMHVSQLIRPTCRSCLLKRNCLVTF